MKKAKSFVKKITPDMTDVRPGSISVYTVVESAVSTKIKLNNEQQDIVKQALIAAQLSVRTDGSDWHAMQAALQIATYINSCH